MIIRLTASCNNRCPFCIVGEEIRQHVFRPLADIISELDRTPPDEEVDIFGGEPTIDPIFWDVLTAALASGRRVTLASNVRLFSHRPAAERLATVADSRVDVRTSLMGHTAALHDRLNGVKVGAFQQTIRGIEHLASLGFGVQVNVVVLAENVDHLLATGIAAIQAGATRLKYSGLVRTNEVLASVPDPAVVRERLRSVSSFFRGIGVPITLEKLTPCLVPNLLDIYLRDSDSAVDTATWYKKVPACSGCRLADSCHGAELGALRRYGDSWVHPLADIPGELIEEVDVSHLDAYHPTRSKPFVRVLFDYNDPLSLVTIAAFTRRNPQLYLIA